MGFRALHFLCSHAATMSSEELQVPSFALLEALSNVPVLRLGNKAPPPCLRPFWEVCWGELYGWNDLLRQAAWHDFVEALVSHVLLTGKARPSLPWRTLENMATDLDREARVLQPCLFRKVPGWVSQTRNEVPCSSKRRWH